MGSVRIAVRPLPAGVPSRSRLRRAEPARVAAPFERSLLVLDIAYVLGVIALFALVGLIGKAVEKL